MYFTFILLLAGILPINIHSFWWPLWSGAACLTFLNKISFFHIFLKLYAFYLFFRSITTGGPQESCYYRVLAFGEDEDFSEEFGECHRVVETHAYYDGSYTNVNQHCSTSFFTFYSFHFPWFWKVLFSIQRKILT